MKLYQIIFCYVTSYPGVVAYNKHLLTHDFLGQQFRIGSAGQIICLPHLGSLVCVQSVGGVARRPLVLDGLSRMSDVSCWLLGREVEVTGPYISNRLAWVYSHGGGSHT